MSSSLEADAMQTYRDKRDKARRSVNSRYTVIGFISSGTYGRVYKAQAREGDPKAGEIYAIKKFKPDKEGEVVTYTGISQSAIREIALNREISNINVIALREVMLETKSIYMVFEYAEHDFLQIIHHHSSVLRNSIPTAVIKSLLFQLFNGVQYLHMNHIIHRDLKPANILVTSSGCVKIGDLGLARLCHNPLQPLYKGDKVVVTIWYRAPELLLGSKHYTKAIDCWALGCIFAELLSLRPIFKGEEAKLDAKKNVPFQRDQFMKIIDVLGTPNEKHWPDMIYTQEYPNFKQLPQNPNKLQAWFGRHLQAPLGYDLISHFFDWNPMTRMTAKDALSHRWFQNDPKPTKNAFRLAPAHQPYPLRRVTQEEPLSVAPQPPTASSNPRSLPMPPVHHPHAQSGRPPMVSAPPSSSGTIASRPTLDAFHRQPQQSHSATSTSRGSAQQPSHAQQHPHSHHHRPSIPSHAYSHASMYSQPHPHAQPPSTSSSRNSHMNMPSQPHGGGGGGQYRSSGSSLPPPPPNLPMNPTLAMSAESMYGSQQGQSGSGHEAGSRKKARLG